jgi:hypothetical protein
MIQQHLFSKSFNKQAYRKAVSTVLTVISLGIMSNVSAKEQWAIELGVFPVCTGCHTSQDAAKDNAKLEARQAYRNGGVIPGLQDFLAASSNAKPVLLPIDNQWNAQVGEEQLSIPLIVKDKESDKFVIQTNAPKGYSFSAPYTVASINLPAIDFRWKPTAAQKNKKYTVNFTAIETTSAAATQNSNTVTANIFVWGARAASPKNVVSQFVVDNAKWGANKLTMTGRIAFKKTATAAAKAAALKALWLNIKSYTGVVAGTPVLLKPNAKTGVWTSTFALTGTKVPCTVKADYEGLNAARTVKTAPVTCLK